MRKLIRNFAPALMALAAALAMAACSGDDDPAPVPVPVTDVTLSPGASDIEIGGTLTLTATLVPANAANKKVTWKSSDDSVATVPANSTGPSVVVTAADDPEKVGKTAGVTVKTDDGGFEKTCTLTVVAHVKSIAVDPDQADIMVGTTVTLKATVLPEYAGNRTVAWTSGNTAVATVSAGVVTGVAAGTATITATAQDGSSVAGTCTVNVTPTPPKIYVAIGPNANSGVRGMYVDGVRDANIGNEDAVEVYVDGANNVHVAAHLDTGAGWAQGAYYMNGERIATFGSGAYGMAVSDGHVYVAGYQPGNSTTASLWRDGAEIVLDDAAGVRSVAHVVTLDKDGHVYVGGWTYTSSDSRRFPVIWVDGARNIDLSMPQYPIIDMTVADNGAIFVTCFYNGWNSGMDFPEHTAYTVQLPNMTMTRIDVADGDNFVRLFRNGADIYLVGYNGNDPCYWKSADNGTTWTKTPLPRRAGAVQARAHELYVHPNGGVYVFGASTASTASGDYQLETWVDGELIDDERRLPVVHIDPTWTWLFGTDVFCGIFVK